jgi:hypothetical protein
MFPLFTVDGRVAARDSRMWKLLLSKLVISIMMVDSLTSLAYAAQIYYSYSVGMCPYMGANNCVMHRNLFIIMVVVAASDTVISMMFTFFGPVWLEANSRFVAAFHVLDFFAEVALLSFSFIPAKRGMASGQAGNLQFLILSAVLTMFSFVFKMIGMRRMLVLYQEARKRVRQIQIQVKGSAQWPVLSARLTILPSEVSVIDAVGQAPDAGIPHVQLPESTEAPRP